MSEYSYVTLREKPELKEYAAEWFHGKWGVPKEAYLGCMEAYLNNETEYGWYPLYKQRQNCRGGMGVIENDFHNRKDLCRYQKWDFGLWAVILKESDEMIGQCGLTMQPWKGGEALEIGYLFERIYWHNGYAIEAAKACKKYAFEILEANEVSSIIRDTNIASQNVAIRNGMTLRPLKNFINLDTQYGLRTTI